MIGDGYQYLMLRLAAGHWPLPVFANNLFCCDTGHWPGASLLHYQLITRVRSRVRKNTLSQITKIHLIHNFKSRGHLWRMIDGGPMLDRDLHNVTNGVMEWRLDRQNIFPGGKISWAGQYLTKDQCCAAFGWQAWWADAGPVLVSN